MKVWAETRIHNDDLLLFHRIRLLLVTMPFPLGASCHLLVRGLARHFGGMVTRDGHFNKTYQHSWLATKHGNSIDAYPVGLVGGPLLLDAADINSPWRSLYVADSNFSDRVDARELAELLRLIRSVEECGVPK